LAYQWPPRPRGDETCAVGPLLIGTKYYWAVDEVSPGLYEEGDTWAFTTVTQILVDDMESYNNTDNLIYETWVDGVADMFSGSWIELAMAPDPVYEGEKSMWCHYDQTGFEREVPYSLVRRTFDPPEHWRDNGEKALVLMFYGQRTNDVVPMFVEVEDANGTSARSIYGALWCDEPEEIQEEEWEDWNINLDVFSDAGVGLSGVTVVTIGFGDPDNPVPADDFGVVYFDYIKLYAARCVPKYAPNGDVNEDCIVDEKDLRIIANAWLWDER
jgi:hypothetical protein